MTLTEKEVAEWVGVPLHIIRKTRRALDMKLPSSKPVRLDEKNLAELLRAMEMPAADIPGILQELAARAEGRQEKKARVLRTTWRNRRLLRAMLLPTGPVISVKVRDTKDWRVNAVIQVLEGGTAWEIDPNWNRKEIKRTRVMRKAGTR